MVSALARILIVDDEPAVAELMRSDLDGFDCTVVCDGPAARDRLGRETFGVLITDLAMPEVDGLALLAHARQTTPDCRVIVVTGCADRNSLARALALGAFDYVEKPFRMGELAAAVRKALVVDATSVCPLPRRAADALWADRERSRHAALESARALVRAVEAKDPFTCRHSEHVAHYALALAGVLGMPEPLIDVIRTAALLHDVGKIGVPDHVLTKPGPLTADETALVRKHPGLGADILSHISVFGRESRIVRHHHEAWDGKGYPDGLACGEIPLASRIICVADAMDAMLMARSFRDALSVDQMLDELIAGAGRRFDREIAAAAIQWVSENPRLLVLATSPAPVGM